MLGAPFITRFPVSAATQPDSWQNFLKTLQDLGNDPTALSIRSGLSVLVLLVALLVGRWLSKLAGRAPLHLEKTLARAGRFRRRTGRDQQSSLGPWLSRLTSLSVWLAALLALAEIWFSAFGGVITITPKTLGDFFGNLALHLGSSLLVFAATLGIARLFQRSLERSLRHRINPNLGLLSGRILYITVLIIGLVVILAILGIDVALPVTLIGALTVALSLALQDVLKNLVSGVYLLIERPFSIGDRITILPYTGVIEDIQIRYTALRTSDGQRVIIPNSMLFSSAVVNLSAYENRRVSFTVTVPDHGADAIEKAVQSIRAALESAPGVLQSPTPEVVLTRAAGGSADLRVIYWQPTDSVDSRATIFSYVLEQVRTQVEGAEVTALDPSASTV